MKKGPVKVRANVDSRYYAGVYPYVTGVIRGTDGANAEEVLSLGHLYEQGAHDNATGVAAIIGAAETMNRLIKDGKLPRPKRTIRVLAWASATARCTTSSTTRIGSSERSRRCASIRRPGCRTSPGRSTRGFSTRTRPSPMWMRSRCGWRKNIFRRSDRPWRWMEHRSSTDNFLGDPSIGIPTVMPYGGYGVLAHHNSGDTPATVDPRSMRDMMVMNAAYTYFIASAGPAEKRWMAEVALSRGYNQVAATATEMLDRMALATTADELSRLRAQARARVDYVVERESKAVGAAAAFDSNHGGLADLAAFGQQQQVRVEGQIRDRAAELNLGSVPPFVAPRNPEAEAIVVRRKRMGTITLDNLGRDQREGFPAASFWSVPVSALYWCDGKRTLAEVIRLTELEMGPQTLNFVGYFKFLEKNGYVEFVK